MSNLSHLSIVVPVGEMAGRLTNLYNWIEEIKPHKPKIILVTSTLFEDTAIEVTTIIQSRGLLDSCQIVTGEFSNPGDSRNKGFECVETDWVTFWDSDDLPKIENVVNIMTSSLIESEDFIIASYEIQDAVSKEVELKINGNDELENLVSVALNPGLWRWFLRSDQITGNRFPSTSMGEDQVFLVETEFWKKRVKFIELVSYRYLKNQGNQLTNNPTAIEDLRYSAAKIYARRREPSEIFPEIVGCRMILTMIKKGKVKSKLFGLRCLLRLIYQIGLAPVMNSLATIYRKRN